MLQLQKHNTESSRGLHNIWSLNKTSNPSRWSLAGLTWDGIIKITVFDPHPPFYRHNCIIKLGYPHLFVPIWCPSVSSAAPYNKNSSISTSRAHVREGEARRRINLSWPVPRKSAGAPVRVSFAGNESRETGSLVTAVLTFVSSGGSTLRRSSPEQLRVNVWTRRVTAADRGVNAAPVVYLFSDRHPATPTVTVLLLPPALHSPHPSSCLLFPSLSSRLLPSLTSAHLRNPETPRVHGASCPSTISTFILNIYIHPVLFMCRAEAQWGRCVQAFPAVSGNPRLTWREDSCLERWGGSGSCSAALKWIEGSLKPQKKHVTQSVYLML